MEELRMMGIGRSAHLTLGLWVLLSGGAIAQPAPTPNQEAVLPDLPGLQDIDPAARSVDEWLAQIAQAAPAQITRIQLEATGASLELVLQTTGAIAPLPPRITGNALVIEIPNAVLNLPEGEDFFASAPTADIALVNVVNLPGASDAAPSENRVQIAITGTSAPPVATVRPSSNALVLSIGPGIETAQGTEDESLQIVVTGEPSGSAYFTPRSSTATRTDAAVLDIPQSVQVIPQRILEDQQILRIDDAVRNVSGVTGSFDPFGGSSLTLRGFTGDSFTAGVVLRDGFRFYDNLGVQETANLERIEVLRGPASVLYGQAAPGGLINLVTKQPLFEPFYAAQLQVGNFGLIRPSFDISGLLTDDASLRYRLNVAYQHEDGFRNFDTDIERVFVAPVLSWNPNNRTTLSFNLEYLNDQGPFDLGLVAIGDGVAAVPFDRITTEPDDIRCTESVLLGYNLEHQISNNWTLQNAFRYVNQDYNVEVFLPFIVGENGLITRFPAIRRYVSNDYSLQTSITGEFSTGDLEHTLLAAVDFNWNRFDEYFTKVDLNRPSVLDIFNPVYGRVSRPDFDTVTPFIPFDTEYDRIGVLLQDQIELGRFILVGSLRYDSVNFRNRAEDTQRFDEAWSPRVGLVYRVADNVSLYTSFSRSFTPNFSLDSDGEFLEPETATGFEIGAKAELFNGNLLATLAFFDITKQNVATVVDPLTGASEATGEQRSQGIEFDISGEILPGWNVIGFYAYTDARVSEDNVIPEGNRLFNVPYNSFGLWTTYEIQTGDLRGLGLGLGVNYVGDRAGDLANSFRVDDYFLTNAAIFYQRDRWRFGLNVYNIFDVDYIRSVSNSRRNGIVPGAPFTIVGSVTVEF
ncbi:TonB-dependent siderophore receptor [Thermoleptolyngbya sp.]